MSQRKFEKRHTRNLSKKRQTYYVSIPIEIIRELGWQDPQRVVVKKHGTKKILIEDWPAKPRKKRK